MRGLIVGAVLAGLSATSGYGAECEAGSPAILALDDWMVRLGEQAADGTRPLEVELAYTNTADKAIALVDGDVFFESGTGELLAAAPITPELALAPGASGKDTSTRTVVNDPLERMIRASRDDVVARTCVTHVRYEDGSEEDFE